jgi:hypothetical protein
MLQVIRQALDVFVRLLLKALDPDDLGDQHSKSSASPGERSWNHMRRVAAAG